MKVIRGIESSRIKFVPEIVRQVGVKIPRSVLVSILSVYERGKEGDLKKIPNDLICDSNGNFWITWKEVFEIRSQIKKFIYREILFRKFNRRFLTPKDQQENFLSI